MGEVQIYECRNPACTLGTPGSPGRFTEGATQDMVITITGNPDAEYGEGICPNCTKPGTKAEKAPEPLRGRDPHQDLHDQIGAKYNKLAARAVNPYDDAVTVEDYKEATAEAQFEVEALIEKRESEGESNA